MHFAIAYLALAFQGPLAAQAPGRTVGHVPRADSIRIVRDARSAQTAFESFRRNQLPVGASGHGDCDIRIGRYCYWRGDDDGEDDTPPEEALSIRTRRDELIRKLDGATRTLSGDAWLAGQHVRYLVEAGRTDTAIAFAARCGAGANWCQMLAGYAAHSAGRFATADSIFRGALAGMDAAERCRWLDVSNVLDDELADRFKKTDCDSREAFVRRVFRLASPLFSISESDVYTEQLSRRVRARIAEHSATPDGEPWADDERELMIRYGWPRWYSKSEPAFVSQWRPPVMGHDGGMPYDYLPKLHLVEHIGAASADDWELEAPRATNGYAPSFARSMHELPSQIATFRRGDSMLVMVAWDARRDTSLLGRDVDAAVALVGLDSTAAITRASKVGLVGHLSAIGVLDSGLVSIELLAVKERRAARARVGIAPPHAADHALSDVLLYSPGDSAATDLASAAATMLASNVIAGSRSVGAFWEAYGLPAERAQVHYTLSVDQIDVGWMQRTKERLHFDDPSTGLRIQWDETVIPQNGVAPRGVRLDLSRLRAGKYHLEVSMSINGGAPLTTARDVELK
jgi:hypothetical protein